MHGWMGIDCYRSEIPSRLPLESLLIGLPRPSAPNPVAAPGKRHTESVHERISRVRLQITLNARIKNTGKSESRMVCINHGSSSTGAVDSQKREHEMM